MAGNKVNIQKSRTFFTPTMKNQKEIRKKIPFDITTRKIKYPGTNLTKDVKELYSQH